MPLTTTQECVKCINTTANPTIRIDEHGLCQICAAYERDFSYQRLATEKDFLLSFRNSHAPYDCLVGFSGGKDSTSTLVSVRELGFHPKAFTLDTGYYPDQIFTRSRSIAANLNVDHDCVDARPLMRPLDKECFRLFAELYERPETTNTKNYYQTLYQQNRQHYSVRDTTVMPFVRSCQICRKIVIRAYYELAIKYGVSIVILGMNEWAGLSHNQFSAIRKLQPTVHSLPVYVVHLPFLLQRKAAETKEILDSISWQLPPHEQFIDSNSNSCLLARATEKKATLLLGFHPDTTRLAREVTVGFITKEQAKSSLSVLHEYAHTPREVLMRARILTKR